MCEKCIALSEGLPADFNCADCGKDTADMEEYYMVNDATWKPVAKKDEMLCVGCLEKRLGRQLRPEDFEGYRLNYLPVPQSARLQSRIIGCH